MNTCSTALSHQEFLALLGYRKIPAGLLVWESYNDFRWKMTKKMLGEGLKQKDIDRMTVPEYLQRIDAVLEG